MSDTQAGTTLVSHTPAADTEAAASHFRSLLSLETDCWDVHQSLTSTNPDFVLLDVRGRDSWDAGHIEGAIHLPHINITEQNLAPYSHDTLFVVYCAGPHCNGADKAALKLAELGRPVKKMLGGIQGWSDEGFQLLSGSH